MKNDKRIHKVAIKQIPDDTARYDNEDQGGASVEYIGICAEAEISVAADHPAAGSYPKQYRGGYRLVQNITSGGLWGVESDSDASYLAEIEQEQLSELRQQLRAIGFSNRAISAAFKNEPHSRVWLSRYLTLEEETKMKYPRAKASYSKKDSIATLTTPDHKITMFLKLTSSGVLVVGVYKDGIETQHRELGPNCNWDD